VVSLTFGKPQKEICWIYSIREQSR